MLNNGRGLFGGTYAVKTIELNRLVANDGHPRNMISFFMAKTWDWLPKPSALVAYADPEVGHLGFVYQATNWLYTGMTLPRRRFILNGKEIHESSLRSRKVEVDKTNSWALLKHIIALLDGSKDRKELHLATEQAKQFLKSHEHSDFAWEKGLIVSTIRAHRKKLGIESYWEWLKSCLGKSDAPWRMEKNCYETYIRAADIFLRNTEEHEWIANLEFSQVVGIPISKAARCCGAIGAKNFSNSMRTALLNGAVTEHEMNEVLKGKPIIAASSQISLPELSPWPRRLPPSIEIKYQDGKHRYVYFLGSKGERKRMLKELAYPILPYPKNQTK